MLHLPPSQVLAQRLRIFWQVFDQMQRIIGQFGNNLFFLAQAVGEVYVEWVVLGYDGYVVGFTYLVNWRQFSAVYPVKHNNVIIIIKYNKKPF